MANERSDRPDDTGASETPGAIRDRRIAPRGVLPRHVQMWLMVAIAVVILAIILFTGQPQPGPRPPSGGRPAEPSLVSPERVRSYEQALAAEAARQQQALAQQQSAVPARPGAAGVGAPVAGDPITDDQRRREYQSLFSDNVALSRRATDRQPFADRTQLDRLAAGSAPSTSPDLSLVEQFLQQRAAPAVARPPIPATRPTPTEPPAPPTPTGAPSSRPADSPAPTTDSRPIPAGGPLTRLLEGTVIDTVLLNRLDGTFAGPVTCLVTAPVYSHDRQSVVIPAGARVLGSSSPVQTWGMPGPTPGPPCCRKRRSSAPRSSTRNTGRTAPDEASADSSPRCYARARRQSRRGCSNLQDQAGDLAPRVAGAVREELLDVRIHTGGGLARPDGAHDERAGVEAARRRPQRPCSASGCTDRTPGRAPDHRQRREDVQPAA
jgi:type IV secretory pathway VirB10-like protein